MRVNFPAKTVLSNLPLKQEKAKGDAAARGEHGKHPDHDGGISWRTEFVRMLVDLERDYVKWMRGELHMDMKNPYSPAIRHFRGQLTTCPNTNSQVPDSHEYNEAITAVADCATKMLETSLVSEAGSCRYCHANSVGVHGATMTRIGRDRQREKCEHQRLPRPEQIVLFFLGVLFVRHASILVSAHV